MNGSLQLVGQGVIDRAVTRHQFAALKVVADHDDLEMRFRAGRHVVVAAFVNDFQVLQVQGLGEPGFYGLLYAHGRDYTSYRNPVTSYEFRVSSGELRD